MSFYSGGNSCSCGCGGRGGVCRLIQSTAAGEKQDMKALNDRLVGVLQHLRDQSSNTGPYHESIRVLETEINKLHNLYESEINKLRDLLDRVNDENARLKADMEKMNDMMQELQNRADSELNTANRATSDVSRLNRMISERDKEIAELRNCLQDLKNDLARMKPENSRLAAENADLKGRLDDELRRRLAAEDTARQLSDKLSFNANKKGQEAEDLAARLQASNNIILSLESKINQLTNSNGNGLSSVLQRLRESTAADLARRQRDTEDALNRALQELRNQLHASHGEGVHQEKLRLESTIQALKGQIADLEAKLNSCCQQRRQLEEALDNERRKSERQISELERKLVACQEGMMNKLKECNAARDTQVSLQAEINAYRSVLDHEEQSVPLTSTLAYGSNVAGAGGLSRRPPPSRPMSGNQQRISINRPLSSSYSRTTTGYNRNHVNTDTGQHRPYGPSGRKVTFGSEPGECNETHLPSFSLNAGNTQSVLNNAQSINARSRMLFR